VVLRLQPNDKWNLHVFLPEWLKCLKQEPLQPLPRPKRIFLFCAYRIQFTHDLNTAILLAWRGHKITVGYLPKLQSPIKEPRRDHPSAKPYLASALSKVEWLSQGRIRCVDLSEETVSQVPLDEVFINRQVRSDLVMMLKRETLNPSDPEVAENWAYYEEIARYAQQVAWSHLKTHREEYDLCLVPNGTTFEGAQFCHVAKRLNIPVNTFEKFAFRSIRVMNHGDNFLTFNDLDLTWNLRQEAGYEDEPFYSRACERALQLMNERRTSSTKTWAWSLQLSPHQTADEVLCALNIARDRPFVLVCTNVPYDAGYEGLVTVFPSMREWLIDTVRFLLEKTDMFIVVRAHPGEAAHYGGTERSEETLARAGLVSDRLLVLPGEKETNTYCLMEMCQFGIVFSSTTGLEMAMMGKQVLVGSEVYYSRRGFTADVKNREGYFSQLKRLVQDGSPLPAEEVKQACLFHFILHFVMQWPYPYNKPSCVQRTPPAKLLSTPDVRAYIKTLDALALDKTEWQTRAMKYLQAKGNNHITKALGLHDSPSPD
jgi:hypothetical protein